MLPTPPEGLRHWHPADAPALAAAWSDPAITAWNTPPRHLGPEEWIRGAAERWERRLALDLVIEAPDADEGAGEGAGGVAGEVGLCNFTRDPPRAELGVWVAGPYRGRGVARRAVDTVTRWALTPTHPFWDTDPAPERGIRAPEREGSGLGSGPGLGLEQVWARVGEGNDPAQTLFAGLGWQRLGSHDGNAIWTASSAVLR